MPGQWEGGQCEVLGQPGRANSWDSTRELAREDVTEGSCTCVCSQQPALGTGVPQAQIRTNTHDHLYTARAR